MKLHDAPFQEGVTGNAVITPGASHEGQKVYLYRRKKKAALLGDNGRLDGAKEMSYRQNKSWNDIDKDNPQRPIDNQFKSHAEPNI